MCILPPFKKQNSFHFLQSKPAPLLEVPVSVSGIIVLPAVQARQLASSLTSALPPPAHGVIPQWRTFPMCKCCAGGSPCKCPWVHPDHHIFVSRPPHLSSRTPQQPPSVRSCILPTSSPLCKKKECSFFKKWKCVMCPPLYTSTQGS